jgi:hypothetical protein
LYIFFIVVVLWFEQGLWSSNLPFYPFLCILIMLCINVVYIVECCITKFKQNQMFFSCFEGVFKVSIIISILFENAL